MEQQILNKEILEELKKIRIDINILKENTIDPDTILTPEEEAIHKQGLKELENGETFTLEDIEKERKNVGLKI